MKSACHQKELLPWLTQSRLTSENGWGQWRKLYWLFSFAVEPASRSQGPIGDSLYYWHKYTLKINCKVLALGLICKLSALGGSARKRPLQDLNLRPIL